MGNPNATTEECYECGKVLEDGGVEYQSLLPREPHFVDRRSNGDIISASDVAPPPRPDVMIRLPGNSRWMRAASIALASAAR